MEVVMAAEHLANVRNPWRASDQTFHDWPYCPPRVNVVREDGRAIPGLPTHPV